MRTTLPTSCGSRSARYRLPRPLSGRVPWAGRAARNRRDDGGVIRPLARAGCRFDDRLRSGLGERPTFGEPGSASSTRIERVVDPTGLVAEGWTAHACVDASTGSSRRVYHPMALRVARVSRLTMRLVRGRLGVGGALRALFLGGGVRGRRAGPRRCHQVSVRLRRAPPNTSHVNDLRLGHVRQSPRSWSYMRLPCGVVHDPSHRHGSGGLAEKLDPLLAHVAVRIGNLFHRDPPLPSRAVTFRSGRLGVDGRPVEVHGQRRRVDERPDPEPVTGVVRGT